MRWSVKSASPSWITVLSWKRGFCNSMKLWAMPCRATQDRWVIVKSSDKMWPTRGGNGKPLQYSCVRTLWKVWKGKNTRHRKVSPLGWKVSNILLGKSGGQLLTLIAPERMKWLGQSRNTTSCGCVWWESEVQCCKEQYCITTWNVRSTNQGKLDAVKQEMVRVNTDILGISELKWMGMGEFNSDDHCLYYCGQESLGRNAVALIVNKSQKCSTWEQSQKQQNGLGLFTRSLIHYSNPSLCLNH